MLFLSPLARGRFAYSFLRFLIQEKNVFVGLFIGFSSVSGEFGGAGGAGAFPKQLSPFHFIYLFCLALERGLHSSPCWGVFLTLWGAKWLLVRVIETKTVRNSWSKKNPYMGNLLIWV